MTVFRASTADFEDAWQIVCEYYEAIDVVLREDRQEFLDHYFQQRSGVWLARVDQAIAGCIALKPLDPAPEPECGEIKRLYVRPEYRGRNIALALLDALHEFALQSGYNWLYLDSKRDLEIAIRFYRNQGYSECDRYNDNPQASIFMRRQLAPYLRSAAS